jgi:hypothetical protein
MFTIPKDRLTVTFGKITATLRPLTFAKLVELEDRRAEIGDAFRALGESPTAAASRPVLRDLDAYHREVCRWGVESWQPQGAIPVTTDVADHEGEMVGVLTEGCVRDLARVVVPTSDGHKVLTQALAEAVMRVNRPTDEDLLGFQ